MHLKVTTQLKLSECSPSCQFVNSISKLGKSLNIFLCMLTNFTKIEYLEHSKHCEHLLTGLQQSKRPRGRLFKHKTVLSRERWGSTNQETDTIEIIGKDLGHDPQNNVNEAGGWYMHSFLRKREKAALWSSTKSYIMEHTGKFFFYKCRFVTEYKREWEANFFFIKQRNEVDLTTPVPNTFLCQQGSAS